MSITLTERAADHVKQYLQKRGKGIGIRLGVTTSGCSGMSYKLEFADVINSDDVTNQCYGVMIVTDPKSLPYIDGVQLDFVREGLQTGFKFNNPNETSHCGCGQSFSVG